jgi:hypothetical protein
MTVHPQRSRCACVRQRQVQQHADGRRLPRSIAPHQRVDRALRQGQAQSIHGIHTAVALHQPARGIANSGAKSVMLYPISRFQHRPLLFHQITVLGRVSTI